MRLLRLALVAAALVPALLFAGVAWFDRHILMEEAAQRVEKTAAVLEQHALAAFHTYDLVFARIDEHLRAVGATGTEAERHAYFKSIDDELKEIGSLFMADASGRLVAHSRYYPAPNGSIADRDYYRDLVPTAAGIPDPRLALVHGASGLAVGAPVTGRYSGTPKLNISRRYTGSDGRFAGVIAISIEQAYFEDFHRTLAASPDDSMALIRADGTVLARSPALTPAQVQLLGPENNRRVMERFTHTVSRFVSPLDGIERMATYRRLADYPIYVGYGLGTAAVLRTWHVHLLLYGAVALLAALALVSVTWLALRAAREEAVARASLVGEMRRREAAETALRQAQKMEAVGQLTGGIAHDFNNLLAAVLGNLELLAKRLPDDLPEAARLRRYVEGATEGARRGATLTQRMLAFARRQELTLAAVDLPALVRGMADLLTHSIGPTVAIETRFPMQLPPAHVDANQFETALLNLAVNARDAMPGGGQITIAGREEAVGLGSPLGLAAGSYVVLAVRDTGEGMDPETLRRASEPFFTTKVVGKGTGLGLAMVHGLAAQSGGALRLASEPGRGTTVELWLPASEAAVAAPPVAPSVPLRKTVRPCRVLVVDDDALVRAGTASMLEDLGHRLVEAASGEAALAVLRAGEPIDLVVTDQMMPGMTGIVLAREIARLHPRLPVLLASGFAEVSNAEMGELPRLAKPFTQAALAHALTEVLAASSAGNNVVALRTAP